MRTGKSFNGNSRVGRDKDPLMHDHPMVVVDALPGNEWIEWCGSFQAGLPEPCRNGLAMRGQAEPGTERRHLEKGI